MLLPDNSDSSRESKAREQISEAHAAADSC